MCNLSTPQADQALKPREENKSMSTTSPDELQSTTPATLIGRAQHVNWSSIPVEHVAEGIQR